MKIFAEEAKSTCAHTCAYPLVAVAFADVCLMGNFGLTRFLADPSARLNCPLAHTRSTAEDRQVHEGRGGQHCGHVREEKG